jgi:hypothetical protein
MTYPSEIGGVSQGLARRVRPSHSREQPRGPEEPKPKNTSGYEEEHISNERKTVQ